MLILQLFFISNLQTNLQLNFAMLLPNKLSSVSCRPRSAQGIHSPALMSENRYVATTLYLLEIFRDIYKAPSCVPLFGHWPSCCVAVVLEWPLRPPLKATISCLHSDLQSAVVRHALGTGRCACVAVVLERPLCPPLFSDLTSNLHSDLQICRCASRLWARAVAPV